MERLYFLKRNGETLVTVEMEGSSIPLKPKLNKQWLRGVVANKLAHPAGVQPATSSFEAKRVNRSTTGAKVST